MGTPINSPNSFNAATPPIVRATQKDPSPTSVDPPLLRPVQRVAPRRFWTSRIDNAPFYPESPWKYYEPFLLYGEHFLVRCNRGTEVRKMRIVNLQGRSLDDYTRARIQDKNFLQLYELYAFGNAIYVILEHVDFNLQDVLQISPSLTEPEISYIIREVSNQRAIR